MSRYRHDEPNASHYSARYAERKNAARKARDESAGPRLCNRCKACALPGSLLCASHQNAYDAAKSSGASLDELSQLLRHDWSVHK